MNIDGFVPCWVCSGETDECEWCEGVGWIDATVIFVADVEEKATSSSAN